ncbi:ATPase [Pseudonocardia sp. Ae168_Ps1]|uniref:vWA domain-containing protein n=1 Tax=unclassified Pseudonocardia TaxID=2619320 RepID=UPI00095A0981|nr:MULTISPECIES: vWA domain-containing protein [unclassified Pseudonocardia]OLL70934.1 ATPase [Pseudonocardia sp. Ae168_Ps1]OLL77514.1 ATPase [Pseudonocardia sp. Ae150A_Ps1]OLL88372.1 ATPase [Pseudonocardia sp. Ae263_Ps1]OLL91605.1 ATPase [Pseudonocardia sp. Ae356_Ps1]
MTLPAADERSRALAPLRRRPKQLTAAPELFRTGPGAPVVVERVDGDRGDPGDGETGGQGSLTTSRTARARTLSELLEDRPPDREVTAMARRIARRLALRRPRDPRAARGRGAPAPQPYRYRSDDIDLDRTVEVLTERPAPEDTDIVVRERTGSPRAITLVVDVSGSMRGEKVRIAAATVAALSGDAGATGDRLALVAFWSDAAVLSPLDEPATPGVLLDRLVRIPARGLTDVGFGLSVAHAELAGARERRRVAVLLSDVVHNAGPDPRTVARRFGELHVLLETDGEHDAALGRDVARLGGGRLATVRTHRDVAPALNRLLRS